MQRVPGQGCVTDGKGLFPAAAPFSRQGERSLHKEQSVLGQAYFTDCKPPHTMHARSQPQCFLCQKITRVHFR